MKTRLARKAIADKLIKKIFFIDKKKRNQEENNAYAYNPDNDYKEYQKYYRMVTRWQ